MRRSALLPLLTAEASAEPGGFLPRHLSLAASVNNSLTGKRICVTGGGGFLGRRVVARLRARGCEDVFVVRRRDYDLVEGAAVERLYREARPQVVIHLAAVVGGIGANRENPGLFF